MLLKILAKQEKTSDQGSSGSRTCPLINILTKPYDYRRLIFRVRLPNLGFCFVNPLAIKNGLAEKLRLRKQLLPAHGTRNLNKADMHLNDALPEISVDPATFDVFVDGEVAYCEPADNLPLTQRYMLR